MRRCLYIGNGLNDPTNTYFNIQVAYFEFVSSKDSLSQEQLYVWRKLRTMKHVDTV